MRVIIACEKTQTICKAFREKGHEAYSCDIQDCTGGYPEWHIKGDALELINNGWDLMIAHPPCTRLSSAGRWFWKHHPEETKQAFDFFMAFVNAPIKKICVENPRSGFINTNYRKPNQTIHPYFFGGDDLKRTGLWLKGLPRLNGLIEVALKGPKYLPDPLYVQANGKRRFATDMRSGGDSRSKTFIQIARAMAEQWG